MLSRAHRTELEEASAILKPPHVNRIMGKNPGGLQCLQVGAVGADCSSCRVSSAGSRPRVRRSSEHQGERPDVRSAGWQQCRLDAAIQVVLKAMQTTG